MGRKININISPEDFQEYKGETIKVKITPGSKPTYLNPREKAHLA